MDEAILKDARILVVDDEPQNVRYLEDVLRWAGYERIESATDPTQAVPLFLRFRPDLVILDLLMPELDGFALLEALEERTDDDDYLPILILTSDASREARRRALRMGAKDYLTKPMSPTEVGIRVRNLLEARFLFRHCREMEERVAEGGDGAEKRELDEVLEAWAAWADAGSREPGRHAVAVAETSTAIGRAMGLDAARIRRLRRVALLSDLPSEALARGDSALLRLAREVTAGLERSASAEATEPSGDGGSVEELLEARIVSVAHRFERWLQGAAGGDVEVALGRLRAASGQRFDPEVVEALSRCHLVGTS